MVQQKMRRGKLCPFVSIVPFLLTQATNQQGGRRATHSTQKRSTIIADFLYARPRILENQKKTKQTTTIQHEGKNRAPKKKGSKHLNSDITYIPRYLFYKKDAKHPTTLIGRSSTNGILLLHVFTFPVVWVHIDFISIPDPSALAFTFPWHHSLP